MAVEFNIRNIVINVLLEKFPPPISGMLAGLSMCFVKSSAISLYAAGKALEVRKLLHGLSLLAIMSRTCSSGSLFQSSGARLAQEMVLWGHAAVCFFLCHPVPCCEFL